MIVFGPLWFVLLMMLLFGIFGGKSKEEKWLEKKQTDNIRAMMAAEQGLTLRQYNRRGAYARGLVAIVLLGLAWWIGTAVLSGHGREADGQVASSASETSGELGATPHDPPYAEQVRISDRLKKAREQDRAVRKAAGY
jgi:hypothetical protein